MDKKSCLFVFLTCLFVLSLLFGGTGESAAVKKNDFSTLNRASRLDVYFFYGEGCPHCQRVRPYLAEMEQNYSLNLHQYDIYSDRDKIQLLDQYSAKYGLPREQRGVPTVFVSNTYFVGDTPILQGFEEAVKKALQSSVFDQNETSENSVLIEAAFEGDGSNCSSEGSGGLDCLSFLALTTAALVDSINPCSFAILVFLIGARVLVTSQKKRALKVGLSFCLSVFIAYSLFGLGLLSVVRYGGFSGVFSLLVGLFALLAGILTLRDVFWDRSGGFRMEVPRSLKPVLMKLLKGVTSPLGAFAMGFVAVCFELPCTGGPYLFVLGQLANSATRARAIPLLLYYNALFVLPLIIVSLLLYSNVLSVNRTREWTLKNKRILHLVGGLAMILLSFLVVPVWSIVQPILLFLRVFRVAGQPILVCTALYLFVCFVKDKLGIAKKVARSLSFLSLLLLSLFTSSVVTTNFLDKQPVYANAVSCGAIITTDTTLTEDLLNCPGKGLEIRANDVTLDCDGHTISGNLESATQGIYLNYVDRVTVKNCKVENFRDGIYLSFASYSEIVYNKVFNCHSRGGYPAVGWGIFLWSTTGVPELRTAYNTVSFNEIDGNGHDRAAGIWLRSSQSYSNVVANNKVYSNRFGVWVDSSGNTISDNEIADNAWSGLLLSGSANAVDRNIVCYNSVYDILLGGGSGDNNMCDKPDEWNDEGTIGCTYMCPSQIKALAVPLNWAGDQSSFNEAADAQLDFFIRDVPLEECPYKVKAEKLSVSSQNFHGFTCSQSMDYGIGSIESFVESLGINLRNYDWIIGFAETSPCPPIGGARSPGAHNIIWVTTDYEHVTAHELGHVYGLADEYCSNPAGSTDIECNDGDMGGFGGDAGNDGALTGDKNWLDADLGCDPNLDSCCYKSCAQPYPYVCCYGNVNSKGGRSTMSYTDAPGTRGFDTHSKDYLNTLEELKCPTLPLAQLRVLDIQSGNSGKVIHGSLWVYSNDSVVEDFLILMDGKPTQYYQQGNYSLRVFDDHGLLLWNEALNAHFGYNGPVLSGVNYSMVHYERILMGFKIPYDPEMYELTLYHGGTEIYSKVLDFCNHDSTCDITETYLSCPSDCPLNATDGICIPVDDGICDPDCLEGVDPDCLPVQNLNSSLGYETIQAAINAPETLDGHTILVRAGTYNENVVINRSLSLMGEGRENTIIDGNGTESVIHITANSVNIKGFTIQNSCQTENCAGIFMDRSNNSVIDENSITNNGEGVYLESSSNNSISGNSISNSAFGIYLNSSLANTIVRNNIWNTSAQYLGVFCVMLYLSSDNVITLNNMTRSQSGIFLAMYSDNNTVAGNNIMENSRTGIELDRSSNNTLEENDIMDSRVGLHLGYHSSNNTVTGNNIAGSWEYGMGLFHACDNSIFENNITQSTYGVWLWGSDNNRLNHNNFINNTNQAYVEDQLTNMWDDNYPSGGNYWSDYAGGDSFYGPYQNETGGDNIGDSPYIIDSNNRDSFLLMNPYIPFENQTIRIRADGSVDPSGAPIQRKGDIYSLTGNITSNTDGIVIERDSIVIDGNGYMLQGTGAPESKGVSLSGKSNVTIQNIKITAFYYGVWLNSSSDNSVSGNTVKNNVAGIVLAYSSSNNNMSRNTIANNGYGIVLYYYSSNNSVSGNTVANNTYDGIWLATSSNNSLSGNTITANTWRGILLRADSSDNSVSGNTVANNHDGIQLATSSNNSVSGNTIANNTYEGIWLDSSSNNSVSGNLFVSDGLFVYDSYGNVVAGNLVNGKPLVYLEEVSDYVVEDAGQVILVKCNNITVENLNLSNTDIGVQLWKTNNTTMSGNTIANNWEGIHLYRSSNNSVSGNTITANNGYGIVLDYYSSNNGVSGNTVANNGYGFWLFYSPSNTLFHNNFINNTRVFSSDSPSAWDDGYPSGGNYWSDYAGLDVYSGPYQNETGSDGIGDTPYTIDSSNQDDYPLIDQMTLLVGDVLRDGFVGIDDLFEIAIHFGAEIGQPRYSRACDITCDGYIGVDDLFTAAMHYGEESA